MKSGLADSKKIAGQDLAVSPSEQSTKCHDLYDGLVMAQGAPLAKKLTFVERGANPVSWAQYEPSPRTLPLEFARTSRVTKSV